MSIKNMIKLEFRLLFSRKEFLYTFTTMMILVCLSYLLKCFGLYGRDITQVHPASQMWFGWTPIIRIAKPMTGLFYLIALPFIASLAYSDTYYVDSNNGTSKCILSRCEKWVYLLVKGVVVFVSGLIVIFIPLILEQIFCLFASPIRGGFDLLGTPAYEFTYTGAMQFPDLFAGNPYLRNLLIAFLASIFGGCISLISYALSFINKKSRLFVVAVPGIAYVMYNLIVEFFDKRCLGLSYYLYSSVTFCGRTSYIVLFMAGMIILSLAIIIAKSIACRDEL